MDTKEGLMPSVDSEARAERLVKAANDRMEKNKDEFLQNIQSMAKNEAGLSDEDVVANIASAMRHHEGLASVQMNLMGRAGQDWRVTFPHWQIKREEWVGYVAKKDRSVEDDKLRRKRGEARKRIMNSRSTALSRIRAIWASFGGEETPELTKSINKHLDDHDIRCRYYAKDLLGEGQSWWDVFPDGVISETLWRAELVSFERVAKNFSAQDSPPRTGKKDGMKLCYHCGLPETLDHDDSKCPKYFLRRDQRLRDWSTGFDLAKLGGKLGASEEQKEYIKMGYEAYKRSVA